MLIDEKDRWLAEVADGKQAYRTFPLFLLTVPTETIEWTLEFDVSGLEKLFKNIKE
jgi:hypothetical protein